jgi:hypothetical protein
MLATLSDIDAAAAAARLSISPSTGRKAASGNEPGRLKRWYESLLGAYRDWFGEEAADAFDKAVRAWHARIEVVIDNGLARDDPSQNDPPRLDPPIQVNRPDHDSVAVIAQAEPAPVVVNSNLPLLPAPKEPAPSKPVRVIARLPVPRPLPEAVKAGDFGRGEDGRCINPSPAEVRAITENHAEQLLLIIQEGCGADKSRQGELARQYDAGIALYAHSFGPAAAERLDVYVRRQAKSEHIAPVWRSPDSSHRR